MIRNLIILGTLLLATVLGTLWLDGTLRPRPDNQSASLGAVAPDFTLTDLAGNKHALTDFRGKAVIINFWASWCAPCVVEFPQMLNLAEATQEKAVFLFISSDRNREAIERFLTTQDKDAVTQENVLIALDEGKKITAGLFKTYQLPESYLIDSNGILREKIVGHSVIWDSEEIIAKVKSLSQ